MAVLDIQGLTVHYGRRVAVDGLSLSVEAGEIVGMLGPNGAGKSTTLLAAAGGILPSSGTVRIADADLRSSPLEAKRNVGIADQPPSLYEFFTVREHLDFVADSYAAPARDRDELLAALGLRSIADRMCRELSFGMRQRVGLAAAVVANPSVVLLDETLNGLDPRAAVQAREVLVDASKRGSAVVMSTHLLGIAERLCHRIVIMDRGKICRDLRGDELEAIVAQGASAIEDLYLDSVVDSERLVGDA